MGASARLFTVPPMFSTHSHREYIHVVSSKVQTLEPAAELSTDPAEGRRCLLVVCKPRLKHEQGIKKSKKESRHLYRLVGTQGQEDFPSSLILHRHQNKYSRIIVVEVALVRHNDKNSGLSRVQRAAACRKKKYNTVPSSKVQYPPASLRALKTLKTNRFVAKRLVFPFTSAQHHY